MNIEPFIVYKIYICSEDLRAESFTIPLLQNQFSSAHSHLSSHHLYFKLFIHSVYSPR
jgi:hypothetical protein